MNLPQETYARCVPKAAKLEAIKANYLIALK